MEILAQTLIIIFFLFVLPYVIGTLFAPVTGNGRRSTPFSFVAGYIAMFASFEAIALPVIFLRLSFHILVYCWLALVCVLCAIAIIRNNRLLYEGIKKTFAGLREYPLWLLILVTVLILGQMGALSAFQHIDDDDAFYVATAVTTVQTDTVFQYDAYTGNEYLQLPMRYALSPFPIFWAALSFLSGIHPTILAHTVAPIFLILLCYIVYYLIARYFFRENNRAVLLFLLIVCLLNIFGFTSIYTASSFLLLRIWQGKAVLTAILLPLLFLLTLRVVQRTPAKRDWILLVLCTTAAATVSSMGIFLAPILVGILALVFSIIKKDIRKLVFPALCCLPNIALGVVYIMLKG